MLRDSETSVQNLTTDHLLGLENTKLTGQASNNWGSCTCSLRIPL